jgi:two-component system, LytTR family, response regulator
MTRTALKRVQYVPHERPLNSQKDAQQSISHDTRLRVLIADDEPLARRKLRLYLTEVADVASVIECVDGTEALEAIRRERPHLLFLDVRMPELDGFEVLRRVGDDRAMEIVFVTAHDEYAVRAFDEEAVDYLLKPFDRERFRVAFDRARRRLAAANSRAGTGSAGGFERQRIVVHSGRRILPLLVEKIEWIESADTSVDTQNRQLIDTSKPAIN